MNEIISIVAGFTAGAAAAMGLGGGFVLILYLVWAGVPQVQAQAANLIFFIPAALVSMIANRKSGLIDSSVIPYAAAAGSVGAVLGLIAGDVFDPAILRKAFAFLLLIVGARELFHRRDKEPAGRADKKTARASV